MNRKNILALLLLFSSVCSLVLGSQPEVTYALEYMMIDFFSQKRPYDGKGFNQPSDAFASQEEAMVNASAYTAPLTEGVSANFLTTLRDVAVVSVIPSDQYVGVIAGQTVNISVVVKNEGSVTETFEVSAYYDSILIGTLSVVSLPSNAQRNLIFAWNTSGLPDGTYIICAVASVLLGEIDIDDNTYIDGGVAVRSMPIHAVPREIVVIGLVVAVEVAMILIVLLMSRRRNPSQKGEIFS